MSDAEILKLAKTLDVDAAELQFLSDVPTDDLRTLRRQAAEALFRADKHLFARVAALSKTVPTSVAAKLTEAVLPPLLAARTSELLEPAKAAELVGKVSESYLADVSAAMDASRAPDVVAAIPPEKVAKVGAELARRGEWVVIGGFVSHISDPALRSSIAVYTGEQLLRISFVMDDLSRLDTVGGLLSDDQLDEILAAAPAHGLWPELRTLVDNLAEPRIARLADRFAAAPDDVRAGFEAAVAAGTLEAAEAGAAAFDVTSPVLLEATRGGHVESVHRGQFVLLTPSGEIEIGAGETGAPVYARSSLKPLQAVALLNAGWPGTTDAVALAAASHNGEVLHREGVRRTLAAAGLDESALRCPAALPGEPALVDYVAGGGLPAPICHNCSGKHAAMAATCVAAGWDVASYLAPDHPLQRAVADEIEALSGMPIAFSSIDGCGAPAHALSLVGLARSFARLATAATGPEATVADAMRAYPQLVGGTGRAVSELMAECPGLVAKDGAEGVWAAALPDGRAFAAKSDDGAPRTLAPLLAAALTHWGCDGPMVRRHAAPEVTGGGAVVGHVRWSSELTALLQLP